MTAFNGVRKLAHLGYFEERRVNRALGVAQLKEPRPYNTTVESCDCPDKHYRPWLTCKHQIAAILRGATDA